MPSPFKLLMLSAMYENGGNTTHRLLDGHPELFVYPFESQPGTKYVNDFLSSMYPAKYRWPVFPGQATAAEIYKLIIDEEAKVRTRTPYVSKFRSADFNMDDEERMKIFVRYLQSKELSRPKIMEAFFVSAFRAWKNYNSTGKEKIYVGYSPIIGVDGEKIINDYKGNGFILHIVRNPFSAYADTKKRPLPLSMEHYITGWNLCQHFARLYEKKYPGQFFILRYEDIIQNPENVLGGLLKKMGLKTSETLKYPSWNGTKLKQVYPWGTVKIPSAKVNFETAKELTISEKNEIFLRTENLITEFDYKEFYDKLPK